MPKIAIYGDSFAHSLEREENAWYNLLDYDVNLFSHVGSNFWYSYKNFKTNQDLYDINILFVTNYGRLNIPFLEQPHWPGIQQIDMAMKHPTIDPKSQQILLSAHNYLVNVRNDEQTRDEHIALLLELKSYDNLLIIPCFPDEMSLCGDKFSMYDISIMDTVFYGIDKVDENGKFVSSNWKPGERRELRACHMNNANNRIFADKITGYIEGKGFKMSKDDFVHPTEPMDYYFAR